MKNRIFSLGIILFCSLQLSSQTQNFLRTYGGEDYDDARVIVKTDDGCYILTGLNKSDQDRLGDTYLMKVNPSGAVVWKKFYGKPREDGGNYLIKCSDGGFLISGHIDLGGGICDGYMIKTSANGEKEWDLFIGGAMDDVAQGVVEWSDGSFFVTGSYGNPKTGSRDVLLCKISAVGKIEFTKRIKTAGLQEGKRIVKSYDNNLLISGYRQVDSFNKDILLLKVGTNGSIIWEFSMKLPIHEKAWGLIAKEGGGCVFTGGARTLDQNYKYSFIAELNSKGELIKFNKLLEDVGESYAYDIAETIIGYSICGIMRESGSSFGSPLVVSLHHNLAVEGFQTISTHTDSQVKSIVQMDNGDYFLTGQSLFDSNLSNILLTRVHLTFDNLSVSFNNEQKNILYPNPFYDFTYLKIPESSGIKVLTIVNGFGQTIRQQEFNTSEILIHRNDLLTGSYIYFVVDSDGQKLSSGKMIVR